MARIIVRGPVRLIGRVEVVPGAFARALEGSPLVEGEAVGLVVERGGGQIFHIAPD